MRSEVPAPRPASVLDLVRARAAEDHLAVLAQAPWPAGHANSLIQIAEDPLLTEGVARALWDNPHVVVSIKFALAASPACPPDILELIALNRADQVAADAAVANPRLPLAVARAADAAGTSSVLRSPHCPVQDLAAGSRTSQAKLATRHRNLPARDRGKLARSRDADLHTDLLANPSLTPSDFDAMLARFPLRHGPFKRYDQRTHLWARHPNASPRWLTRQGTVALTNPDTSGLGHTVALHPSTPQTLLTQMALHRDFSETVVHNVGLPPELLLLMTRDLAGTPGWRERNQLRRIVAHPATPLEALSLIELRPLLVGNDTHSSLVDELLHSVVLAHARTAEQATVVLGLARTWPGTVGDLLVAAKSSTCP